MQPTVLDCILYNTKHTVGKGTIKEPLGHNCQADKIKTNIKNTYLPRKGMIYTTCAVLPLNNFCIQYSPSLSGQLKVLSTVSSHGQCAIYIFSFTRPAYMFNTKETAAPLGSIQNRTRDSYPNLTTRST